MFGIGRPERGAAATRAIVLKFVVVTAFAAPPREMMRQLQTEWPDSEREAFRKGALERQTEVNARLDPYRSALTPWEREYSASAVFTMTNQQQIDACHRLEACGVLLWALGVAENVPAYDTEASADE